MRPIRNPRYLTWIRSQPCVVCRSSRSVEASHTGPHGLGQKSPDTSAIPLCARHHRTGPDSYHRLGPRRFAEIHDLDIAALVRRLNLKPQIRIQAGLFVGLLEGEEYVLGEVRSGIESAVSRIMRLCREDRLGLAFKKTD